MTRQQMKIGLAAVLAILAIAGASWWAGQRPYLTPGNHQVFHEGSTIPALAGFLVFMAAAVSGLFAVMLWVMTVSSATRRALAEFSPCVGNNFE